MKIGANPKYAEHKMSPGWKFPFDPYEFRTHRHRWKKRGGYDKTKRKTLRTHRNNSLRVFFMNEISQKAA